MVMQGEFMETINPHEKAFNELKAIGAPVNFLGSGWSGNALFSISGESNCVDLWADYHEFEYGAFGVSMKIIDILNKYGLWCEWQNSGVLDVFYTY